MPEINSETLTAEELSELRTQIDYMRNDFLHKAEEAEQLANELSVLAKRRSADGEMIWAITADSEGAAQAAVADALRHAATSTTLIAIAAGTELKDR